jgi:hypothetical protein
MKQYSPPNNGYPQELPNRWRFDDGSVVENLQSLTNAQLSSLGWVGPITFPKPFTEKRNQDGEVILDENENPVMEGDYDLETHKAVWYAAQQNFVIVKKDVDETLFGTGELILTSGETPDWNTFEFPVEEDVDETLFETGEPISISGETPDWNTFKSTALASTELNRLLGEVLTIAPVVGVTFPAAFFQLQSGRYEDFNLVWNSLLSIVEVSPELIEEFISLAVSCHLPEEFIDILS